VLVSANKVYSRNGAFSATELGKISSYIKMELKASVIKVPCLISSSSRRCTEANATQSAINLIVQSG
jgi:hypothetical protein